MSDTQKQVTKALAGLAMAGLIWLALWLLVEMEPEPEPWPATHPPSITPSVTSSATSTLPPTSTHTSTPAPHTSTPTSTATPTSTTRPTRTPTPTATLTPTTRPTRRSTPTVVATPEILPETGGSEPDLGLFSYLAEQLPVAVLLLLGFYLVARYAAGVMDKLLAQQGTANEMLGKIIDRNTKAWGETTVALARLTEGVSHLLSIEMAHSEEVKAMVQELHDVRTLMAMRPCIGQDAVRSVEKNPE